MENTLRKTLFLPFFLASALLQTLPLAPYVCRLHSVSSVMQCVYV